MGFWDVESLLAWFGLISNPLCCRGRLRLLLVKCRTFPNVSIWFPFQILALQSARVERFLHVTVTFCSGRAYGPCPRAFSDEQIQNWTIANLNLVLNHSHLEKGSRVSVDLKIYPIFNL